MELTLIRHFATAGNLEKRYIGTTDEPILPVAEKKQMPRAEIVLTSPMIRCRQTAEFLYPEVEQIVWDGFRECDFGAFEGKNYLELTGDPSYQAWIDSGGELPFPGGESKASFCERTRATFERAVEDLMEQKIERAAIVAHGGTLMAVLSAYAVPKLGYYEWSCGNGCGYQVRIFEDRWKTGEKQCKVERKL